MKEKILMLKSIVSNIQGEISSHKGTFYWNLDDESKEEYMNKYFPNFDALINRAKIWVDLNIEFIDYYLSNTKYYLDKKSTELYKKDVEVVKNIYCRTINNAIDKTNRLEYLDVIHDVIRKQITDKDLLTIIGAGGGLDKLVTNLDNITAIIIDSLNRFISNINNMYLISNKSEEKEHLDCMIDELKKCYLVKVNNMLGTWYRGVFGELLYQQLKLQ